MRFNVTVRGEVDVKGETEAKAAARELETLLKSAVAQAILRSRGIALVKVVVEPPTKA